MLSMFADMVDGIKLEHLQTHLCKFSQPSVPLQLHMKFTIMEQKNTKHLRAECLRWIKYRRFEVPHAGS